MQERPGHAGTTGADAPVAAAWACPKGGTAMALRPNRDLHVGACNAGGEMSSCCPPIIALLTEAATAA